jgi:hypothetical protein
MRSPLLPCGRSAARKASCSRAPALQRGGPFVLFTIMIGVTVVPISISGWDLRELAVIP